MLTPRFELSQTDSEILITIHAPYTNIKETEVYVEKDDFRFFSMPYYLRLKLPGEIVENDTSDGHYDSEKGDFFLRFSKTSPGEHFENLDMITSLLMPSKKKTNLVPKIEVIGNPAAGLGENEGSENEDDYDNQWFIDQQINQSLESLSLLNAPKYGFGNKISGALAAFDAPWIREVFDLPSPDSTPVTERKILREKHENAHFDEEHYMADLMELENIDLILEYEPEWHKWTKNDVVLVDIEKDILKELPNKEFLLSEEDVKHALLGVVDILFGSCYNERSTNGENTVESGWTINKLSSTLCWFETFTDVKDVVRACMRRSLCYPLMRNWQLSLKVLEDVKKAVKLGKKYAVKRFCEIHGLFNNSFEPRYLLNELYIKDYLVWLQQISDSQYDSLVESLSEVNVEKQEMGLELIELEQAARSVYEENLVIANDISEVTNKMNEISVDERVVSILPKEGTSDDDTDTSSTSSSSSDGESSSTSSDSSLDSDDFSEPEDAP